MVAPYIKRRRLAAAKAKAKAQAETKAPEVVVAPAEKVEKKIPAPPKKATAKKVTHRKKDY
jgi:hypothetical protein